MRLLTVAVMAALAVLFFRPNAASLFGIADSISPVELRFAETGENENEANEDSNDDNGADVEDDTQGNGSGETGSNETGEKEGQDSSGPLVRIGGNLTSE